MRSCLHLDFEIHARLRTPCRTPQEPLQCLSCPCSHRTGGGVGIGCGLALRSSLTAVKCVTESDQVGDVTYVRCIDEKLVPKAVASPKLEVVPRPVCLSHLTAENGLHKENVVDFPCRLTWAPRGE